MPSCPKDTFCKVEGCTGKHSTFLHHKTTPNDRDNNDEEASANKAVSKEPPEHENGSRPANTGFVKMTSKSNYATSSSVTGLAIVPVRVKAKGRPEMVETYAFLDSGSNTSFCTESLLKKLNHEGKKTRLSLTTMQGGNSPIIIIIICFYLITI